MNFKKAVILAGGTGSRLFPLTITTNKHLLPIYDRQMIYYSLSTLFFSGIKDYLIVIKKSDYSSFYSLLGNGYRFGVKIKYIFQNKPVGIADGLKKAKNFIGKDNFILLLGDNFFFGNEFSTLMQNICNDTSNLDKNHLFAYYVKKPSEYGVCKLNKKNKLLEIVEKPKIPPSNYAVTGLYFYQNNILNLLNDLKKSPRGELEITDLNNIILKTNNKTNLVLLSRGITWIDAGTVENFNQISNLVSIIEKRQGLKVLCPEEISLRMGFLTYNELISRNKDYCNSEYLKYLEFLKDSKRYIVK